MSRPKTWYEFHASKFEGDTAHLTNEQVGAYLRLLNFHFQHDYIPTDPDQLRLILRETKQKTRKIIAVLDQFFYEKDGRFFQKRMVETIAKAAEKSRVRKAAANKRWHPKASANAPANADTVTDTVTINTKNTSASGDARQAKRFAEWWAEYPNKKDKKKALAKWKARQLDRLADTLISDTKRRKTEDRGWLDGFVPLPTTYINGDRWEDAIEAPRAAVNLKSMTDGELLALAKQKGISTDGLYRNQLIDRIQTA